MFEAMRNRLLPADAISLGGQYWIPIRQFSYKRTAYQRYEMIKPMLFMWLKSRRFVTIESAEVVK